MKKTAALLAFAAVALAACDMVPMVETVALDTGRSAAKSVVGPIVAEQIPGPAGVVLTDCIIDNASGEELLAIAAQGATPANITLVSAILERPSTIQCATTGLT